MKNWWIVVPVILCGAAVGASCGGSTGETSDSGSDAPIQTDSGPACAAPAKMCGTTCTNVETDNANCGACGNACPSGEVCASGTCGLTCGLLTTCTGDGGAAYCANTHTDNANCGACGNACPAGKVCDNGTCSLTCGSLTTCAPDGGAPYCANTKTDDANCGACGNVCPSGQTCSNGACSATCGSLTTCTPDGGAPYCANTQTDNANCGTCGTTCPAGQSCVSGSCQLPPEGCGLSDPYWSDVLAYVSCNGSSISDSSGKSTLSIYNGPTISTSPAGAPGGSSCSLGNAGLYGTAKGFQVALPSALGTGDFTVEIAVYQTAWYDPTDNTSNILVTGSAYPPSPGGFPTFFSNNTATNLKFAPGMGGGAVFDDTGSALGTWEYYAASRVSGVTYLFRQGTLLTSFADTSDYSDQNFFVGLQQNGTYNALIGSVGQIRVTTVGRYTASYTPCSGAFATQ